MNDIQLIIEQALSLRAPQKESLDLLAQIMEKIVLSKDVSLDEALALVQEVCPSVKNFERDFPCLCFSIATGVGKTRLMGAMIAYLHAAKGIRNFMVLAPNLTIYNKLKTDFTPNTQKYVFPGLRAYVGTPQIITGDDFEQRNLFNSSRDDSVTINIFNISKIDSDKDSKGTPRVRRMSEILGQSYFDYLSDLDDLVLIMDEAHRYRAKAGMTAINELKPVLGIELTATAKSTGTKAQAFKNIVYEYNLAHAIHDGFVKKPAVVGRNDFDKKLYGDDKSEELEDLKIKDGIKIHESLKTELQVYTDNKKTRLVKPFMMIVAENIRHAEKIEAKIKSDDFEEGRYKDKVIVVNSKQGGELKDEVLQRLLAIEDANEPTEIVIHVNMLGEGWDVNNLYTIVPLRAANSKILVEQSIGRGLRLPFGSLTGVDIIDRLHIIAHEKFNEIIEAANKGELEFQKEYLDEENDFWGKVAKTNHSKLDEEVASGNVIATRLTGTQTELPVFTNEVKQQIGEKVREAIDDISRYVLTQQELTNEENQEKIVELTRSKIQSLQQDQSYLLIRSALDVPETVRRYTEKLIELSIDIPRIKITFDQEGDFTFDDFDIDVSDFNGYRSVPQRLLVSELLDKKKRAEINADFVDRYSDITHYLLIPLMEKQEIAYHKMSDQLFKWIGQVIGHITSYSGSELDTRKILYFYNEEIADKMYRQIKAHKRDAPLVMNVKVAGCFASMTSASYKYKTVPGQEALDFRTHISDKHKIKEMFFTGFDKCLFSKQRFDSVTEKDFAQLLERTPQVLKWFKINDDRAKEYFDIKYFNTRANEKRYYLPDFIVETTDGKYMIETKAEKDMDAKDVLAKKDAAVKWCEIATGFEKGHSGKKWHYLLIPDTTIVSDRSFEKLAQNFEVL